MVNNLIGVKDILRILYFVVGIWIIYDIKNCKNYFKHSCGMTSMYRLPQFQTLHNDDKNNYRMYIYGEGNYFRKIINTNIFEGIPIIYIPGNRAPADMARSIGSILQNKTEMRNVPYHFNVFAAHLNEEPSTFDVKTLKRHAKYLEDSIKYVDSLYKKRNHKFVVIGHSISGIAFKIALSQSKWLRDNVKFVISLGTAYKEHQFKITGDFINLWREMNTMVEVPIISFHGGLMDENAEESLTGNDDGFSYNTQSMDRVWTMADHNCLVWCNQLQRLLFEYAEDKGDKFSRQNIDKVLDKIFNSTTIEYPVFSSNDKRFKLLNIEETSKNDYIFVIRKTNKNIGPLYQYYTTLKATKDYFYDHKMTYTYSLDPLANKISYYYDTTSEYKLIKEDEIVALSPSIASTKKNYRNSDKIRIFSIPFLSPNIVYRVTTTDYSKIIFKSKLNQAISQDNILIFNFFDQDDNENGKLFIIPHPEKYNDIKENRMEINIELGLTVIRVIKLNITSIPFMLSFIAMLFSFNSNILTKFFIFNFIIFCLR
uniref:GPI inositol-deacylase n=1 Tax=Parastrongyloides trichosuri TaxID=131310 RepID=A0A0N4ZYD9_PARTI